MTFGCARMSVTRRQLLRGFAAAAASVATPSWAYTPNRPLVLKFSHVVADDTPKGLAAQFFAKRVTELTAAKVRVEVYPSSSLHSDKDEIEALQVGAVQLLAPSLAKFGLLGLREFEVFDLPFLFDNLLEARQLTQGKVGQLLMSKLSARGLLGLGFWENGFKSFSATTPLIRPVDFKGKRIRIQPSSVLDAQIRALGAVPYPLAFSELPNALRTGLVDGQEGPLSNFYTQSLQSVQKHLTLSEHGYLGYAVIANQRFWERMPGDLRSLTEVALLEATDYANSIAHRKSEEALQAVLATGKTVVHRLNSDQRLALRKALLPVHRQMEGRIGRELLTQVYAVTGFDPSAA